LSGGIFDVGLGFVADGISGCTVLKPATILT